MDNDTENVNSQNDTETTGNEELELDLSDDSSEEVENLKKENATLQAQKEHWRKKATEKKEAPTEQPTEAKKDEGLSQLDVIAIAKADIHEDDIDYVVRWAKFNGISVKEALADKSLKTVLADKVEERNTANATQIKSPRTSPKVDSDVILAKAERGDIPESDEAIAKLAEARMAQRLQGRS